MTADQTAPAKDEVEAVKWAMSKTLIPGSTTISADVVISKELILNMARAAVEAIAAWNRRSPSPAVAQPMETAPKDREIMLFARGFWYIGQWDDDRYSKKPRPLWFYSAAWGKSGCRGIPPVAWMPLPAPPKENDHGHS